MKFILFFSVLSSVRTFGLFPWWTKYIHREKIIAPVKNDVPGIDAPKLCVNCKFYLPYRDARFSKCAKLSKDDDKGYQYITDEIFTEDIEYYYCSTARTMDRLCGKDAKMYEENSI